MNSWKKILLIVAPLTVVVAAPLVLRDSGAEDSDRADLRLDVITPHTETLRREFGEAFAAYWEKKTGESVYVNFLVPGAHLNAYASSVTDSRQPGSVARQGAGLMCFLVGEPMTLRSRRSWIVSRN